MEFSKTLWHQAINLEKEFDRRGEILSWRKIAEAFNVDSGLARGLNFALANKHIFQSRQEIFPASTNDRLFLFGDVHVPFQDKLAVETTLAYADEFQPTTIVVNGDLIDFYKISRFVKNPSKKSVKTELLETKEFLTNLRKRFPKARIIFKQGNHEERLEAYIFQQAEQISDLLADLLVQKLDLPGLNIEYQIEPFAIGKLWILHGHEKPAGGAPEWICNVVWKYVHTHFVVNHFHRNQTKQFKDITGKQYWTGACGYLAGEMDYALINQWQHGFMAAQFAPSGRFRAQIHSIVDGEIY